MKTPVFKHLFTTLLLFALSFSVTSKAYAQCGLSNLRTDLISITPHPGDPTKCDIVFNVGFDVQNNQGFKQVYLPILGLA